MHVVSRAGMSVGAALALAIPLLSIVAGLIAESNVEFAARARGGLDAFGTLAWVSLFVAGPVGIAIVGRSAGIRGALSWTAWLVATVPAFVVIWLAGISRLSGALGNPFRPGLVGGGAAERQIGLKASNGWRQARQ